MTDSSSLARVRNVFEIDSARNQYEAQLPKTFVDTQIYWRLFSPKNQILVGSRGSGKTAILKMLSLPYLVHFDNSYARSIIAERSYIGVYIPVTTLWLGPLKSKRWRNIEDKERDFIWHFAIAACQALAKTANSCLSVNFPHFSDRLQVQADLIDELTSLWFGSDVSNDILCRSLDEVAERLGDFPLKKNTYESEIYLNPYKEDYAPFPGGAIFYSPSLDSLLRGMSIVERKLKIDPVVTAWTVCIDEVETLDIDFQRILNTFMRADFGNKYFKIATLPYAHKTLSTNVSAPLQVGHDFEYIWIDEDPASQGNTLRGAVKSYQSWSFAHALFRKRQLLLSGPGSRPSMEQIFGLSEVLNPIMFLGESAKGDKTRFVVQKFEDLALRHFNPENLQRVRSFASGGRIEDLEPEEAHQLDGDDPLNSNYGDQIIRKTLGFLLLRDALISQKGSGKPDVYCGADMIVRLADGNARNLIRLLNSMLRDGSSRRPSGRPHVPYSKQHEIAVRYSQSVLDRTKNEEDAGPQLHQLLMQIGERLRASFHRGRVGTDHIGRFKLTSKDFAYHRPAIELGLQLGLLRADLRPGADFVLPSDGGTFRMSYVLCPAFGLMPRRGKTGTLNAILKDRALEQPNFDFGTPA